MLDDKELLELYGFLYKDFYTTTELADVIDMTLRHVQLLVKEGKIKTEKPGKYHLIPRDELLRYLRANPHLQPGYMPAVHELIQTLKSRGMDPKKWCRRHVNRLKAKDKKGKKKD